jgi:hypothetical protein
VDTGENQPMTERKAGTEIVRLLLESGPVLKISKASDRSKKNLYIYFFQRPGILKIEKPVAHGHKVLIQFYMMNQSL